MILYIFISKIKNFKLKKIYVLLIKKNKYLYIQLIRVCQPTKKEPENWGEGAQIKMKISSFLYLHVDCFDY